MPPLSFRVQEHTLPTAHIREYPRATAVDQEDVLHLAIKQYTPLETFKAKQKVTIIAGHANGFPKELYEPLWDELFQTLKERNIGIRSIWIADVAHQGASGVLNERILGSDPSWFDHPRDLFLMVNHFREHMKRPLIGIGHSMGGNNLINLSLMHPRLFTTLILMDPVVQRLPSALGNMGPAKASTNRRDRWPSRRAAEAATKKSKFYSTWDPRVLDLWIAHGLRDLPTYIHPEVTRASATPPTITADPSTATVPPEPTTEKEVTLSTTKHQEVMTFMRPNLPSPEYPRPETLQNPITHPDVDTDAAPFAPFYRPEPIATFHRLPFVRPSVFYVFAELSWISNPLLRADKLAHTGTGVGGSGGVKKGRVDHIMMKGVGHLIPMEDVVGSATACATWLAPELESWQAIEEKERQEWAAVPRHEKPKLSEAYVKTMNSDWVREAADEEARKSKL